MGELNYYESSAIIFSIDENENFAKKVAKSIGANYVNWLVEINKFSDGEITVQYKTSIRGQKVYLICSTINSDNIMKLMLACDAARRASAREIVVITPYFGYSRQDRKDGLRGAVGAKVVANMLKANGADRLVTIELHADQIQGFFDIPVDHISGWNIFLPYIKEKVLKYQKDKELVLCSPDAGGVKRVSTYVKLLNSEGYKNVSLAMFNKLREKPNEVARLDLIGDVNDKDVYIIDDMIDTAGTLCGTSDIILDKGAKSVNAIITHGILSGPATERIYKSSLNKLIISDTINQDNKNIKVNDNIETTLKNSPKIDIISCANQIGRIIKSIEANISADLLKSNY